MKFFEALRDCGNGRHNISFTVIHGEGRGEKALFSDGSPVFLPPRSNFLSSHQDELAGVCDTGIFTLAGTSIYAENIAREQKLVICGAGHVSMPIIRLAKTIGFNVTVIDDRAEFAGNAKSAGADVVMCEKFSVALSRITGGEDTYFVVVTRGHAYDSECLRIILNRPRAYVGMMGSKRRVQIVRDGLLSEGFSPDEVAGIHSPIGLAINAETPEEIAVSIMAEIIQVKNQNRHTEFPADILRCITSDDGGRMVLCTIVSKHGAGPRSVGTKMLCTEGGRIVGTIGGGLMEAKVIRKARELLEDELPAPALMQVELTAGASSEEGEVCGGTIRIFLERVE